MAGGKILGLDIGTNSIGWAILETDEQGIPSLVVDMGVRIFEPGILEGQAGGNAGPKNKERREARLIRRRYDRRRRKKARLFNILKRAGLLTAAGTPADVVSAIDRAACLKYRGEVDNPETLAHTIVYYLRARALEHKLTAYELGRILYHLGQRRGFLSNRKAPEKGDEGVVKSNISALWKQIVESGCRTLGEYLSKLDPEEQRIRARYTHRQMYQEEFELIWKAQQRLGHAELTDDLKKEIGNVLFFQRPLKSVKQFIGKCMYEPEERRCPWFRLEAQRFRYLQVLNNLRLIDAEGEFLELTGDQRIMLASALENSDHKTFTDAKKILGLKTRSNRFNMELEGEKNIRGNRTNAALKDIFGERWDSFPEAEKKKVLLDLHSFEKEAALVQRGIRAWGLTKEKAEQFSQIALEEGYCNLSLKAINKLTPLLEQGISYAEAVVKIYGGLKPKIRMMDYIPALDEVMGVIRNPIVHRCLTELRKCVNPIVKRYGRPDMIHVELAREVKLTRKEKDRRIKKITQNEKARRVAAEQILKNTGIQNPSRNDVLKYLLAEECNWICPYTGKSIGWTNLFGSNPDFDIEHIIPRSVSLDDSFVNKTLCEHDTNVHVKRKRTPYGAFGNDPERYQGILSSVKRFKGDARNEKLRRFTLQDTSEFEDFTARHLNDTRYASLEAVTLLSVLYGGVADGSGKLRIQTVKGPITYLLRNYFGFNSILGGDEDVKTRDDHRHHAIDALVVALTSAGTIKKLAQYTARYEYLERVPFGEISPPWENAVTEIKQAISRIIPVHRYSKRVRGPLHEQTLYGKGAEKGTVHWRKPLDGLNQNEVLKIVDPEIRRLVQEKLASLGENDPAKAFAKPENRPVIATRRGKLRRINRVRIATKLQTRPLGVGDHLRNVKEGNNHHMEIFAVLDQAGSETAWDGEVVSLLDAVLRLKNKEPVVRKDFGEGKKFKFSLCPGDMVEMEAVKDKKEIFVVRVVPQSKQMSFVRATEARKKKDIQAAGEWITKMPNTLRTANGRKVFLTPFGEVRYAND